MKGRGKIGRKLRAKFQQKSIEERKKFKEKLDNFASQGTKESDSIEVKSSLNRFKRKS